MNKLSTTSTPNGPRAAVVLEFDNEPKGPFKDASGGYIVPGPEYISRNPVVDIARTTTKGRTRTAKTEDNGIAVTGFANAPLNEQTAKSLLETAYRRARAPSRHIQEEASKAGVDVAQAAAAAAAAALTMDGVVSHGAGDALVVAIGENGNVKILNKFHSGGGEAITNYVRPGQSAASDDVKFILWEDLENELGLKFGEAVRIAVMSDGISNSHTPGDLAADIKAMVGLAHIDVKNPGFSERLVRNHRNIDKNNWKWDDITVVSALKPSTPQEQSVIGAFDGVSAGKSASADVAYRAAQALAPVAAKRTTKVTRVVATCAGGSPRVEKSFRSALGDTIGAVSHKGREAVEKFDARLRPGRPAEEPAHESQAEAPREAAKEAAPEVVPQAPTVEAPKEAAQAAPAAAPQAVRGADVVTKKSWWAKASDGEGPSVMDRVRSSFKKAATIATKHPIVCGVVIGAATKFAVGTGCIAGLSVIGSSVGFPMLVAGMAGFAVGGVAGALNESSAMKAEGHKRASLEGLWRIGLNGFAYQGLMKGVRYGVGGAIGGAAVTYGLQAVDFILPNFSTGVLNGSHALWAGFAHTFLPGMNVSFNPLTISELPAAVGKAIAALVPVAPPLASVPNAVISAFGVGGALGLATGIYNRFKKPAPTP